MAGVKKKITWSATTAAVLRKRPPPRAAGTDFSPSGRDFAIMAASKSGDAAIVIRILFIMLLGLWTAAGPGVRVAAAADAPPEHPATATPIITDTAVPVALGQLSIQPFWAPTFAVGNLSSEWRRMGPGGNFRSLQIPVKITYGLVRNMEIYAQIPFIHNWADDVRVGGAPGNRAAEFSGVGDLAVTLKYQLLEETPRCPTVSAILTTDFPTGHHFHTNPARLDLDVLGAGAYVWTFGANLSKWLGPVYLYSNLWYSISSRETVAPSHLVANPLMAPVLGRDLITWNLAAEWPLVGGWVALLEFYSSWNVGPLGRRAKGPPSILMGLLPGIEYVFNSHWSCELGVAVDLAGKNSLYGCTPIFTVTMTY
jgi:hypothetical protein